MNQIHSQTQTQTFLLKFTDGDLLCNINKEIFPLNCGTYRDYYSFASETDNVLEWNHRDYSVEYAKLMYNGSEKDIITKIKSKDKSFIEYLNFIGYRLSNSDSEYILDDVYIKCFDYMNDIVLPNNSKFRIDKETYERSFINSNGENIDIQSQSLTLTYTNYKSREYMIYDRYIVFVIENGFIIITDFNFNIIKEFKLENVSSIIINNSIQYNEDIYLDCINVNKLSICIKICSKTLSCELITNRYYYVDFILYENYTNIKYIDENEIEFDQYWKLCLKLTPTTYISSNHLIKLYKNNGDINENLFTKYEYKTIKIFNNTIYAVSVLRRELHIITINDDGKTKHKSTKINNIFDGYNLVILPILY
jgi:hypothetical protein